MACGDGIGCGHGALLQDGRYRSTRGLRPGRTRPAAGSGPGSIMKAPTRRMQSRPAWRSSPQAPVPPPAGDFGDQGARRQAQARRTPARAGFRSCRMVVSVPLSRTPRPRGLSVSTAFSGFAPDAAPGPPRLWARPPNPAPALGAPDFGGAVAGSFGRPPAPAGRPGRNLETVPRGAFRGRQPELRRTPCMGWVQHMTRMWRQPG